MDNFLRKAGFDESLISEMVGLYETTFRSTYDISTFAGIDRMLHVLKSRGIRMGIVSSNTAINVQAQLGPELSTLFDFIWGIDNGPSQSKQETLAVVVEKCEYLCGCGSPSEVVYVGDTLKDFKCSEANGFQFIGVNWGFEDMHKKSKTNGNFAVVNTVADLQNAVLC